MKLVLAIATSSLIAASSAWAQSTSTGRADDNYGTNAAAGNNASSASTDPSANQAKGKKPVVAANRANKDRRAANQPAPGNSPAETAGAATPNNNSRPEAAH
jgi:hypothetical protein